MATEEARYDLASGAQVADKTELAAVQGEDKLVLQSYGRPYKYGHASYA